jgi:hypothetical protein
MKNVLEESYNFLINKWASAEYKGRGSIHCVKPLDYSEIVCRIIAQMRNKNPTVKIFIAVKEWAIRVKIYDKFKELNINTEGINCVTETYLNAKYTYSYDICFIVGINEITPEVYNLFVHSKFRLMILTDDIIDSKKLAKIYEKCKPINNPIDANSINAYRLSLPVEEHQIAVDFPNAEHINAYNQYSEYITQVLQIFGDFNNIAYARKGAPDGRSSEQVLNDIAKYNGWSSTMDMSNPFTKQIDECYNPIVLGEKAHTCYDVMRKRGILVSDNSAKLEAIGQIVRDNPDDKIIIISKRGEFAAEVTNYLNETFGEICGDYHDKVEPRIMTDDNGVPILYKSGSMKGQPRIAHAQAIGSRNLDFYNRGRLRVLSLKNASNTAISASFSVMIITSSLCDTIDEIRYRFNHLDIDSNKLVVYKLFMNETIEEKALGREKTSPNHIVIEAKKNFTFGSENNEDIIC